MIIIIIMMIILIMMTVIMILDNDNDDNDDCNIIPCCHLGKQNLSLMFATNNDNGNT